MPQRQAMPPLFKGIALFTPGGDLAYCIDEHKQSRWHLHLCAALQDRLSLPEPPHFLVPCYTATVDRWQDPRSSETMTVAEARPLVMHHQALLSAVFGVDSGMWQSIPTAESELCDPLLLTKYRQRFPQLWQYHDLVAKMSSAPLPGPWPHPSASVGQADVGCLFTLFIAGQSSETGATLRHLRQALQQSRQPYTLKVVDTQKHLDQALAHRITVTPTLIKTHPEPANRFTGQLTKTADIVDWLKSIL
ncbi:MAG: circadian clock KaiB family protein [Elainellaceae cyanobacterium]